MNQVLTINKKNQFIFFLQNFILLSFYKIIKHFKILLIKNSIMLRKNNQNKYKINTFMNCAYVMVNRYSYFRYFELLVNIGFRYRTIDSMIDSMSFFSHFLRHHGRSFSQR